MFCFDNHWAHVENFGITFTFLINLYTVPVNDLVKTKQKKTIKNT